MDNINLQPIISAVIALIAALITTFLIPYIKGKISKQQYDRLLEAVRIAVAAAEQIFTSPQSGADKKQYVQEFLAAQGYDVADQEIDTMIEATVGKINGVEV